MGPEREDTGCAMPIRCIISANAAVRTVDPPGISPETGRFGNCSWLQPSEEEFGLRGRMKAVSHCSESVELKARCLLVRSMGMHEDVWSGYAVMVVV